MFDIGEMFRRIFTPAGTGGLEAQNQMAAGIAREQATRAIGMQRDAVEEIARAAIPPIDSEEARVAAEDRIRGLVRRGSFMDNFTAPPGAAGKPPVPTVTSPMAPQPINYQQLFGRGV